MKIGFIGSGNMTSAIVAGMVKNNFDPSDIYLSDIDSTLLKQRKQEFNINITDNKYIAKHCDLVFLAVKPQIAKSVCENLTVGENNIIVSIMAGITTNTLSELLKTKNIIRTMPNTPAMVGIGATGIFSLVGKNSVVEQIFTSIGVCVWVEEEQHIDTITALSGSGPAYFYTFFEAMINSATAMGLNAQDAKKLCLQTAMGSAIMAKIGDISTLRENVTSKGGTTFAALESLKDNNFNTIIDKAMTAAQKRAYELSTNL